MNKTKLTALLFSIVTAFSQSAIAASYTGAGYTLTWDDAASLTFNGEYFEKIYGYSNSFSNSAYTKYTVDNFDIQIVVDNGYFINRVNMWLYGGYDTTILDTPANGSANITLDSIAVREDGSLAGSYAGQGNLFNYNPANGLTRLPPDGDFIAYGIYASTYDPPINYMFEVSSSNYYTNNAIVNIEIDKIRIGFQVVQVPEPSSYAMLGLGLGVLGFAAIRRRNSKG